MLQIQGYTLHEEIGEHVHSRIYRAVRQSDNVPVVLKALKHEYPTPAQLARYQKEFDLLRTLRGQGVVDAYELLKHGNSLVMALEDIGGVSVKQILTERRLTPEEFLHIAMRVTEILGRVHAANVIHKDINPSNIIYNADTGDARLIDFGIAARLSREMPDVKNPDVLEGTLAYISPEQTGRMNRSLDYRTDFYSLGVTLYEMLTGELPFTVTDPMELVHAHIAKTPAPPHELIDNSQFAIRNSQLVILSAIIMKLMAKNAEDRYQSSVGLTYDLEQIPKFEIRNSNSVPTTSPSASRFRRSCMAAKPKRLICWRPLTGRRRARGRLSSTPGPPALAKPRWCAKSISPWC